MQINPLVIFRKEFDGSGILFCSTDGQMFGINATSAIIWEGLERGESVAGIVAELVKRTSGVPETVSDDVEKFIGLLREKGFVSC